MKKRIWKIYKHTLLIGEHKGWAYIGITQQSTVQRWKNGLGYEGQLFGSAVRKYGWNNFSHEIIEDNIPTLELANLREQYWIAFFHTYINDPDCRGYNTTRGGDGTVGYKWNEESKKKLSSAKKGIHHSEEYNARLSKITGGRDIICIETGQVYHGESAAGRITKIRHIGECCRHQREIAGGYHWAYVDDLDWQTKFAEFQNKEKHITKFAKRAVRCIETGDEFESIAAANKSLGAEYCINRAIRLGYKAAGYHWEYINDNN